LALSAERARQCVSRIGHLPTVPRQLPRLACLLAALRR
jgi:hypothetical protein